MKASVGSFGRFVRKAGRLTMKHTNDAESCRSKMSAERDSPSYLHLRSGWRHAKFVLQAVDLDCDWLRVLREALQHP
jgi:hypothetical protein